MNRCSGLRNPAASALGLAVLALACAGLTTGCRSSVPTSMNTHVGEADTMVGRVIEDRPTQTFTFEGVESSVLDFTVRSGDAAEAAPTIEILDPDGERLPVPVAVGFDKGSATVKVVALVLPKTGIYQVIATPTYTGREIVYSFEHSLGFPAPAPRRTHLSAEAPQPLYFSAPRGGFVAIRVTRDRGEDFVPDILAVQDPWGGPALDSSQVPCDCLPPRVSRVCNDVMILTFTAPKPGIYTVMAGAKPGQAGSGTIAVEVRKPRGSTRHVYHGGDGSAAFGTPGRPTATLPSARTA
ncbi:MAG: hypothetical protein O2894_07235, partial [Planctomycetota bacterium]|nr:hypothetical protein [Planctomycetota bacterium]